MLNKLRQLDASRPKSDGESGETDESTQGGPKSQQQAPARKKGGGANPRHGTGVYALVLPLNTKSQQNADAAAIVNNMSGTQNNAKKDARTQTPIRIALCDFSKVPLASIGDFDGEESVEDSPVGPLFVPNEYGDLRMSYFFMPIGPIPTGRKLPSDVLFAMGGEKSGPAELVLSKGLTNRINVFGAAPSAGDVIELGEIKLASLSTEGKGGLNKETLFWNSPPTGQLHSEYNSWPKATKLALLFAYPALAKMPTSKKEMSDAKIAAEERHACLVSPIPEGRTRMFHKTGMMGAGYLVHVPCRAEGWLRGKRGEKAVRTCPLPSYEYSPENETMLKAAGLLEATNSSASSFLSREAKPEELDAYYSGYAIASTIGSFPAPADIIKENKEGGEFWKAEINIQCIVAGSKKAFFDPKAQNPISFKQGGTVCDPFTGLSNADSDGNCDFYRFERRVIQTSFSETQLVSLGPTELGAIAELLDCHPIGFSCFGNNDVKDAEYWPEGELEPFENEAVRWERNLSADDAETKRLEAASSNFSFRDGANLFWMDDMFWHLPEYLEVFGLPMDRKSMIAMHKTLLDGKPVQPGKLNVSRNEFHKPSTRHAYVYLNALACKIESLSAAHNFYALVCPGQLPNVKVQQDHVRKYDALKTRLANDDWESDLEKSESILEFLESCTWTVHYYAVNTSLMKMARNAAKKHFFECVDKIKDLREGKPFFERARSSSALNSDSQQREASAEEAGHLASDEPPKEKANGIKSRQAPSSKGKEKDEQQGDEEPPLDFTLKQKTKGSVTSSSLLSGKSAVASAAQQTKRSGSPKPPTAAPAKTTAATSGSKRPQAAVGIQPAVEGQQGAAKKAKK